jgi:spermidine synthase
MITFERENQRQIVYDGTVVMNLPVIETATYEQLVHVPMLVLDRARRVLILGSGAEGLIKEVLKHPVEQVVTVQIDRVLANEIERTGGRMIAGLVADSRVQRIAADPRRFIERTSDSFDLIIVGLPAALNLNSNRLFTVEFFKDCAARLTAEGMVVTYTPGNADNLLREAGIIAGIRQTTLRRVFSHQYAIGLDFPLLIASREPVVFNPETLAGRLGAKDLELSFLTPGYLRTLLDRFRQEQFQQGIVQSEQVNEDLQPRELFFNLLRETRRFQPGFARFFALLPALVRMVWLPVLIMTVIIAVGCGLKSGNLARGFGIFSSGFAGAAISSLTVMIYQLRFGSVYSGVALLFSGFMLGTVAGARLSNLTVKRIVANRRAPAVLFLGGDCLLLTVPAVMLLMTYWGGGLLFVLMMFFFGTVVGWEFGIASIERQTAGVPGAATAGILSVLDFSGGALGGIITAVIIVPVAGFQAALILLAVLKLSSAISQLLTIGGSRFTIQRV